MIDLVLSAYVDFKVLNIMFDYNELIPMIQIYFGKNYYLLF